MEGDRYREGRLRRLVKKIKDLFKREPPPDDDPYALVTAPRKPRPPHRSASVAELPEQ